MGGGSRKRPVPKLLAKKLKRVREHLGVGQLEMAKLLRDTPSPPDGGLISRFERGEREPNLFVILAYARLAQINPAVLIDDEWNMKSLEWALPKGKKKSGESR